LLRLVFNSAILFLPANSKTTPIVSKKQTSKIFFPLALDSLTLFADNNSQHSKGDDRGKYVSKSRQRCVEQWLKLPPGRI